MPPGDDQAAVMAAKSRDGDVRLILNPFCREVRKPSELCGTSTTATIWPVAVHYCAGSHTRELDKTVLQSVNATLGDFDILVLRRLDSKCYIKFLDCPRLFQSLIGKFCISIAKMCAWKETARQKRQQQASSIPVDWRLKTLPSDFKDCRPVIESCGILTAAELEITNTTEGPRILQNITSRIWTSEAVATAFCKRAAVAQQLIGCCTEMFFEKAIQRAKELDEFLSRTGKPIGPLHGLPISLKDSFDIEGEDTTLGWVGLVGKPAAEDGLAVQQLKSLGAILYCKTNIPQSLMMSDSFNNLFLQSLNTLNRNLISGGSSGGEGALVGARGSFLGMGTDIGGSIRIPAVLQGLYGLNPTVGRVPNRESTRTQKYVVPPVAGPIASALSSIEMFMESYLSSNPWESDPKLLPIPWRKELANPPKRPLKIAFITDDGIILPQPPIQRAVNEIVTKLRKGGHEVIEWDCKSHHSAFYDLWLKAILADGGQRCADFCKLVDEPLIEGMLVGKPENYLTLEQRQELEDKIWEYQREYLRRWTESGIDALVAPALPWVSFKPKTWVKSQQCCAYTSQWNLLNYASLVVPAIVVDKNLDQPDQSWKDHEARSPSDKFNHDQYDIELVSGMPVGVQIVGGRFGEEKAVAVAKVIESLGSQTNDISS
jgi:amidase